MTPAVGYEQLEMDQLIGHIDMWGGTAAHAPLRGELHQRVEIRTGRARSRGLRLRSGSAARRWV